MRVLALCLLALCACKDVDVPWQRPACAPLQLNGDVPEVALLQQVHATGDSVLVLWRGAEAPDDRLLLSVYDGERWMRPDLVREHAGEPRSELLGKRGVLSLSIDEESAQAIVPDGGASSPESYQTQVTLLNDGCNQIELGTVRAARSPLVALSGDGSAIIAWQGDGTVEAAAMHGAQAPLLSTLATGSAEQITAIVGLTALSDNSVLALLMERGPTDDDPQRVLTRRFVRRWQDPVEHVAIGPNDGTLAAATSAAGPNGAAALLWAIEKGDHTELQLRHTDARLGWSDPIVLYTTDAWPLLDLSLVYSSDGSHIAALWQAGGGCWARLMDGDQPMGEATLVAGNCPSRSATIFDLRNQLLLAWGNEQTRATLFAFDGTHVTQQLFGQGRGAAMNPMLTAGPAGPIMAVWEQHQDAAYTSPTATGEKSATTPSSLLSAEISDGVPQDARPIIPDGGH